MTSTATTATTSEPRGKSERTGTIGGIIAGVGLFIALVFGTGSSSRSHSSITFNPVNLTSSPWHVGTLTLPTRAACFVMGAILVAIGAEVFIRRPRRGVMARFSVAAVFFLLGLIMWAGRTVGPSGIGFVNLTALLVGSATLAMVLVYGSLSGVMCERAGVVNIAIEGQFIGGALLGSMLVSTTHSFFVAAAGGLVIGGLLGWVLAFLALRYMSDQIIVGVVLVTMMSGLSSYLNLQILSPYPQYNIGNLAPDLPIPLLSKLPLVGPVFFNQSGFFYLMLVLVAVVSFGLFKTRWGLRVRAVGEHPNAAASVGINVVRVRYINVILGGAIAGIGGVAFMAAQGQFNPGYTSGLGYIALAALIFGRWRPSGAVVASVIFGISVYLAANLQTYRIPVPSAILSMFPYVITIVVVSGLIGRGR
jgi:ABC-type uncharacterized transport system permease subunit